MRLELTGDAFEYFKAPEAFLPYLKLAGGEWREAGSCRVATHNHSGLRWGSMGGGRG